MLFGLKPVLVSLLLVIQTYWDLRYRELPLVVSGVGGVVGIAMSIYQGREVEEIFLALLPGAVALFLGKITRQAIGYGDGVLITILGCYVPLEEVLFLCMFASVLAGIFALVLLIILRKKGTYEIPFVPFLFIAWVAKAIFL